MFIKLELECSLQSILFFFFFFLIIGLFGGKWFIQVGNFLNYLRFSQKSFSGFSLKECFIGGVLVNFGYC